MDDELKKAASMLNHAAIENQRMREILFQRYERDPIQVARGVAKYYLGMFHMAQIIHKLTGPDYAGYPVTEDQKAVVAHLLEEMRKWHLANFGVEPPWVQAIQQAKKDDR